MMENCIYCGGEIFFGGDERLVKCVSCGRVFAVAKFQSEQAKARAALEASARARAELEAAEQARDEARRRLGDALDVLGGIETAQAGASDKLDALLDAADVGSDDRAAMRGLLEGIASGQSDERDALSRLLCAVAAGGDDAQARLSRLQDVAGRILDAQGDIIAQLQMQLDIVRMLRELGLSAAKQQRLADEFRQWSASVREADVARLEAVRASAGTLLEGQRAIDRRLDGLRSTAQETLAAVEAFRKAWEADRLDELDRLYRQAERFQADRDFDRALDAYRQVIVRSGPDAEVYWRMLLCYYCVEYQRDDDGAYVPTILNPDLTDPSEMSLRRALAECAGPARGHYEAELGRIDRILDGYRALQYRVKYDVFISVKQAEDGRFTADSDSASDLYDYLTGLGLRVFNSRRTVIPAGQAYEPYIISALLSARVLIVVGASADHMCARWVRNEWSRFQWLQRHERQAGGKTDRVLFCYLAAGMQPRDIPRALNPNRQAVLEGVTGGEQLRTVMAAAFPERFGRKAPPEPEPSLEVVLTQMIVWLYNRDFDAVQRKYAELVRQARFMDSVPLHLYALCASRRAEDLDQLAEAGEALLGEGLFKLARKVCRTDEDRALLDRLAKGRAAVRAGGTERMGATDPTDGADPVDTMAEAIYREALDWQGKANALAAKGDADGAARCRAGALEGFRAAAARGHAKAAAALEADRETRRSGTSWRQSAAAGATGGVNFVLVASFRDKNLEAAVRRAAGAGSRALTLEDAARLTELDAAGLGIEDLTGLEQLTGLTRLNLSNNALRDDGIAHYAAILPLAELGKLTALDLSGNQITSLFALRGLRMLRTLDLRDNRIEALAPLKDLTALTELYLDGNRIADLGPLVWMASLEKLGLGRNRIDDLGPLASLTALRSLAVDHNKVVYVKALASLTRLAELDLSANAIASVEPLANLGSLARLDLSGNWQKIDLSPVRFVKALKA